MKFVAAVLSALALSACGGGAAEVSHATVDVRNAFIAAANADGVKVSFVSDSEKKANTVIISDKAGAYFAYDLSNYTSGQDFNDWLTANMNAVSGRLTPEHATGCSSYDADNNCESTYDYIGGYRDDATGIEYEENSATSKDLQKIAAFKQSVNISRSTETLKARFGLSDDRAREVARLAVQLAGRSPRSMTDADYDSFSMELTGSSIRQMRAAMSASREGNTGLYNDLVDKAAKVNGVGPEHMNEIIKGLMN